MIVGAWTITCWGGNVISPHMGRTFLSVSKVYIVSFQSPNLLQSRVSARSSQVVGMELNERGGQLLCSGELCEDDSNLSAAPPISDYAGLYTRFSVPPTVWVCYGPHRKSLRSLDHFAITSTKFDIVDF